MVDALLKMDGEILLFIQDHIRQMDGLVLESSDSSGRRRCFLDSAGNNSSVFQKDKTCGSCRIAGTAGGGVDHECLPEKFCGKDKTL